MIAFIIIVYAIFAIIISFVLIILLYPFVSEDKILDIREKCFVNLFFRPIIEAGIWQYNIEGLENIKDEQYIVVCNHNSFIDSVVLMDLGLNANFLIAQCFYDVPIVGWISALVGDIPVDKTNSDTKRKCIEDAIALLNTGRNIVIYPEGRRSLIAPKLENLNHGAFTVAKETKTKILPITLTGTSTSLFNETYISMHIGEPFHVSDINESMEMTKRIMNKYL